MKTLIALMLLSTVCYADGINTDSGAKSINDGTTDPSTLTPDMSGGHSIDTDSGAKASNQGVI